jgi:hypothetical protein
MNKTYRFIENSSKMTFSEFYKYITDCIISWFLNISLYNLYIKLMLCKIISIYKLLFSRIPNFDRKTKFITNYMRIISNYMRKIIINYEKNYIKL